VARPLRALEAVGLGYLPLGQATATLSGGELQRARLAPVLAAARADGTVVLLDEPTIGLHHTDVDRLLGALHDLVERGCTVVVIEHSLDVVAAADLVVDLGPEGGPEGGHIVCQGPPEVIAACSASHTGRALADRRRSRS
jgi:excinuclease ABC subunit A